jgi:hypothetical protein
MTTSAFYVRGTQVHNETIMRVRIAAALMAFSTDTQIAAAVGFQMTGRLAIVADTQRH